jgi:hypothetical protein
MICVVPTDRHIHRNKYSTLHPSEAVSALPGDEGHDEDVIPILEGSVQPLQGTAVLPVDEDVERRPDLAIFAEQLLLDSCMSSFHLTQGRVKTISLQFDPVLDVRVLVAVELRGEL